LSGGAKQVSTKEYLQAVNNSLAQAENRMDAGLAAYHPGEFSVAFNPWQQVLELNPQHQDAQNSVQNTPLQLSNLNDLRRNN
jgi:hypothetical protein